jgi:two-component system chemotaxis sensor kinase CheA
VENIVSIDTDDEILRDFLIEAGEILESLGGMLVELERRPQDAELLNSVFRGFHTIKGGAGFLALNAMVEICHRAEDVFNVLRQGERRVDAALMDTVLRALDVVREQFRQLEEGTELVSADADLLELLERYAVGGGLPAAGAPVATSTAAADTPAADPVPADALVPPPDSVLNPWHGPAALDETFPDVTDEEFAVLTAVAATAAISPAAESAPESSEEAGPVDEMSPEEFERLLDELHGKGGAPAAGPPTAAPLDKGFPSPVPTVAAEPAPTDAAPQPTRGGADTTVRVDTGRLDQIMNMVGELVLVRNRLATLKSGIADEAVSTAITTLELVTSDLQAAVMKTRMQPIGKVFGRFPRVMRDLARSLNKQVELELHGEETDLDKNLVEALADPLVHLVRNAVDHGIETPAERERAGKPAVGRVVLSARQEGDHILLTISDDGAGMDAEVLRGKAVEKGLLDADVASRLTEADAFGLIFRPGFSTKTAISDISGRGVGMDVVKTRIDQLNGAIAIESVRGAGTRISIKLPLTLAILPTLMVEVGKRIFALPLSSVSEIFQFADCRTTVVDNRPCILVREKVIPLFDLRHWFLRSGTVEPGKGGEQVVIAHLGSQRIGLMANRVLGQEEVVIKPLGALLRGLPGFAGATITGDGQVALILDIPGLVKSRVGRGWVGPAGAQTDGGRERPMPEIASLAS